MSSIRLGGAAIFCAAMIAMGSLHQEHTTWNVNSRMALVFAVVERGTFAIDGYVGDHDLLPTMDKAVYHGHEYSDKVFGVSLLGIPVYAAMHGIGRLLGIQWSLRWKIYVLRMACASLPAAISLVLLWLLMLRAGAAPRRAMFAVVAAFFGSLWFGYSTIAMPYSPGIAACFAATFLTLYPPAGRLTARNTLWIGFLCGFALICDFIFGLMVAAIAVVFVLRLAREPRAGRPIALASAALGGAIPLLAFFAYTYAIFGHPTIPYQFEAVTEFREEMSKGLMGVTLPRLGPAWFLTLHPYRGVFFWSSWLALALAGCVMAVRATGARRIWGRTWGWMGLWAFTSYLVFNSGYYMWWGGWSMGARLMLPMMAAVPMGLAEICRADRARGWWWALVATGAMSIVLCAPLSLMDPQLRQQYDDAMLMTAGPAASLAPPQFTFLRVYYSGDWFIGPGGVVHGGHFVPPVALALSALILWLAAARLPASVQTAPSE